MNQYLKTIKELLQQNKNISDADKEALLKSIVDADKQWSITEFKLDRTEKVKKTTAILLEETIQELELKRKAVEAQNRELEIETALEKVRSRSLAMHKSNELQDVVNTVFEQLNSLHVDMNVASIFIFNENSKDWDQWVASADTNYSTHFHLSYTDNIIFRDLDAARQSGKEFYTARYSFEEKNSWFSYAFANTEYRRIPEERKNFLLESEFYLFSFALSKNVGLQLAKYSGNDFSEIDNEILKRFCRVFEQAYIRFLDLQKAEAQAREATIEAALERVRSRTMAMHNSSELTQTAELLFDQLKQLGAELQGVAFAICDKDSDMVQKWTSIGIFSHPYTIDPGEQRMYEAWKKGEGFYEEVYEGERQKKYYEAFMQIPAFKQGLQKFIDLGFPIPTWQKNHAVTFKYGYLLFITTKPFNETQIFLRFGKVFEQTYTRFLDLQRAEAQAREAKIEAALERVRSRTMAMQKSEDMNQTASEMFKQIQALGMQPWACGFNIFDKDEKAVTQYMSLADGGISPPFRTPLIEDPFFINIYDARQRRDELLVMESSGKELAETYRYMFGLPGSKEIFGDLENSGFEMPKFQITHCAYFSQGYLVFITYQHVSEAHDIFKRFAKVFEQTYTRFLDLQKAEAQSRESQVQLALERVRAKTMAMQKSDELREVSLELYRQLKGLGESTEQLTIGVINEEDNVVEVSATLQGSKLQQTFKHTIDEPYVMNKIYKGWKAQQKSLVIEQNAGELQAYNKWRNEFVGSEMFPTNLDDNVRRVLHIAYFSKGMLGLATADQRPKESLELLERFAGVFDLTYTRFLDLQKAEAQAREAQIEASLERVRASTMGMHRSSDLLAVINLLADQFQTLGFKIHSANFNTSYKEKDWDLWLYFPGERMLPDKIRVPYIDHPYFNRTLESVEKGDDFSSFIFTKEEKDGFLDHIYANTPLKNISAERKKFTYNAPGFAWSAAHLKNAVITIANYDAEPYTEEQNLILRKFGKVFEQAYTRFLDLQKAEAQAREAQIEAALEKVRSRSLAMQKSEELKEVIQIVYEQFVYLNVNTEHTGFVIDYKLRDDRLIWVASKYGVPSQLTIPYFDSEYYNSFNEAKEKGWDFFATKLNFEDKNSFYRELFKHIPDLPEDAKEFYFNCQGLAISTVLLENVALYIENFEGIPYSDEDNAILMRFGKVFQQTYTRFLDLQKAEAQAKEATIEAALERVRGKAMAMHNSNDLSSTASTIFTELRKLGINPIRCGVGLLNKESHKAQLYSATSSDSSDSLALVGWVQLEKHPVLEKIYDSWVEQQDYFPELQGKQLQSYYQLLLEGLPVTVPDFTNAPKQHGHFISFSIGCLYAWSNEPYNDDQVKIMRRFGSIVDLTFRRYLELQQSEMNAREAVKQAALDRIRADIASMRTVTDLDRITPLIWNELTILGIPFIRCGVFIMDDSQQLIHTFLSTPDGKAIAAFHLPYDTPGNIGKVLSHWKDNKNYIDHWDESAFIELASLLVKQGAIASTEQYLKTIPRGGFYLHFLPFLQGMLYVGNSEMLGEDEIKLIQSVADAFSTAYARYEDFNKLEAAKKQVDSTLNELQATQRQLIQSEKMASLGELTAGIAHEIQNPLNFVNNFSEVSSELLEEMKQELANGNWQLVTEIADDVKQNLEKINHHGKRADGIVKGMLQHSRTSSGTKELTDVKALTDEYLRLAYHGLRAKDKSFNAKFETDFDNSIEKINVVPQDIGRVILNLINNAFYAVSEKQKAKGSTPTDSYEPKVIVTTKRLKDKIEIKVADNGNGIPQNIIEKIFQPFFTTKPTGQGTGLGLSLSYDIITKGHGGEIKVETTEGQGTEFSIHLPVN